MTDTIYCFSALLLGIILPVSAAAGERKPDPVPAADKVSAQVLKLIDIIHEEHVCHADKSALLRWALDGLFAWFEEPAPPHLRKKLEGIDSLGPQARRLLIEEARAWLGLPGEKTLELAARGIFTRLEAAAQPQDRSGYRTADNVDHFSDSRGHFVGVGLKLESDPATGLIRVKTPIFKSPAYEAGLRAGDLITHIRIEKTSGNKQQITLSTEGMPPERAAELLLGPEGTRVGLVVRRPG